jgi:hypothetical protein
MLMFYPQTSDNTIHVSRTVVQHLVKWMSGQASGVHRIKYGNAKHSVKSGLLRKLPLRQEQSLVKRLGHIDPSLLSIMEKMRLVPRQTRRSASEHTKLWIRRAWRRVDLAERFLEVQQLQIPKTVSFDPLEEEAWNIPSCPTRHLHKIGSTKNAYSGNSREWRSKLAKISQKVALVLAWRK